MTIQILTTMCLTVQFSSVTQLCMILQLHGLQHARLPCPSSTPRAYSNSCPSCQWYHPIISFSVTTFSSCLQSFPASVSLPIIRLFASDGQSIGASALVSVLPMNIQGRFPLGLTGLISLQSKGLSRVFSSTIAWKHQFFGALPSLWSTLTSISAYWKHHSLDYKNYFQQSDIFTF